MAGAEPCRDRYSGKLTGLAVWLREYGEAIEADLAFRGIDLRDFYAGRMSARRLAVLVANLPPDTATVTRDRARTNQQQADRNTTPRRRHLAPVRSLEDIPVVSPGQAMRFVNASNDEFSRMTDDEAS